MHDTLAIQALHIRRASYRLVLRHYKKEEIDISNI